MEISVDPVIQCDNEWRYGWLSPRISFSQDFVMIERVSAEKRKRDDEIANAECSSEFEFRMANVSSLDLLSTGAENPILPADELFSDGKVIPLHLLPKLRPEGSKIKVEVEQQPWSMLPPLNFKNPGCSSMSLEIERAGQLTRSCVSLENSRCSSPSRSFSLPLTTPPSPKAPRLSGRIKDLFFKKSRSHTPEPSQELAESSSRRRPISARSFWPFSRSISAIESKITKPPVLPRRSNSAAERKITSSSLHSSENDADGKSKRSNGENIMAYLSAQAPSIVGKITQVSCFPSSGKLEDNLNEEGSYLETILPTVPISAIHLVPALKDDCKSSRIRIGNCRMEKLDDNERWYSASNSYIEMREDAKEVLDSVSGFMNAAATMKSSGGTGKAERKAVSIPVRSFGRASPERKGAGNNAVVGRPVLRNLESCSANSKARVTSQDVRVLERQKSYSTSVRVTPVLNVPACISPSMRGGKSSKNKLLNLLWRKEKQSDVPSKGRSC